MSASNKPKRFLRGVPLAWGVMTLSAIGIALVFASPYITFNPAVSRIPINLAAPLHFLVISTHAVTGRLALIIGLLSVFTAYPPAVSSGTCVCWGDLSHLRFHRQPNKHLLCHRLT